MCVFESYLPSITVISDIFLFAHFQSFTCIFYLFTNFIKKFIYKFPVCLFTSFPEKKQELNGFAFTDEYLL